MLLSNGPIPATRQYRYSTLSTAIPNARALFANCPSTPSEQLTPKLQQTILPSLLTELKSSTISLPFIAAHFFSKDSIYARWILLTG